MPERVNHRFFLRSTVDTELGFQFSLTPTPPTNKVILYEVWCSICAERLVSFSFSCAPRAGFSIIMYEVFCIFCCERKKLVGSNASTTARFFMVENESGDSDFLATTLPAVLFFGEFVTEVPHIFIRGNGNVLFLSIHSRKVDF